MAQYAIALRHSGQAKLALCSLVTALTLYALSPLAALWTMANGLQHHDVSVVRRALDWNAVRIGFKEDFGGEVPVQLASANQVAPVQDELPGFGESFASTIVSRVVDESVTPERVMAMLSADGDGAATAPTNIATGLAAPGSISVFDRIGHIAFLSPTRFEASFKVSEEPGAEPVRLSMRIEKWHWKITHIQLPASMLNQGNSRNRA